LSVCRRSKKAIREQNRDKAAAIKTFSAPPLTDKAAAKKKAQGASSVAISDFNLQGKSLMAQIWRDPQIDTRCS
jgi:hypothetical protein